MDDQRLKIGEWAAERMSGRLERAGEQRTVEPKVMDLLFILASEPGRVFGHDDLHTRLWPTVTVGGDSLARCVSKLRKALATDSTPVIETVPKRGYRLVAPVQPMAVPRSVGTVDRRTVLLVCLVAALLVAAVLTGRSTAPEVGISKDEARLQALAQEDRRRAEQRR